MESGALSSPEFKAFKDDVVLFAHVTSQVPGEKHGNLLTEKGGNSFPTLMFMDEAGEKLGDVPGRDVPAFVWGAESANTYARLNGKAESLADKVELLAAKAELGKVDLKAGETERGALGELSAEHKARLETAFSDLKIMDVLQSAGQRPPPEKINEIGKGFYAMHKAGVAPRGDQAYQAFYGVMMQFGEATGDVDAFAAGLGGMKSKYGHIARAKAYFDKQEQALAELRKKAAGGGDKAGGE